MTVCGTVPSPAKPLGGAISRLDGAAAKIARLPAVSNQCLASCGTVARRRLLPGDAPFKSVLLCPTGNEERNVSTQVLCDAPPVIISAVFVWATALLIWIKAKRAEKLGPGGEVGRVEKQLERRIMELEDRHIQQMADMEDQHARSIAELEEHVDFAERLLTKEGAGGHD